MAYTGPKIFRVRKTAEEIEDDKVELLPVVPTPREPDRLPIKQLVDPTPKPKEGERATLHGQCVDCLFQHSKASKEVIVLTVKIRAENGKRVERRCMGFGAIAAHVKKNGHVGDFCDISGVWRISRFASPIKRWVLFIDRLTFNKDKSALLGGGITRLYVDTRHLYQSCGERVVANSANLSKSVSNTERPRRMNKNEVLKICREFEH
jgi:hypothetical protein